MKYKTGDKFMAEVTKVHYESKYPYELMIGKTNIGRCSENEVDEMPQFINGLDKYAYNRGLEDAWKYMRKIWEMGEDDYEKLFITDDKVREHEWWNFGTVLEKCTPQEAIKKYKQWEEEKSEIQLGDEVINTNPSSGHCNCKGIVIQHGEHAKSSRVIWEDGKINKMKRNHIKKTGNNYAEDIKVLLNKIGG